MYSNFSNSGIDSFPFNSGSFRPASAPEENVSRHSDELEGVFSASGAGFLSWMRMVLQH